VNYNYPQARELTEILVNGAKSKEGSFFLAISGGKGASVLFSLWKDIYSGLIPWEKIELFWVDERCVPPDDSESNYGNARRELLDHIHLPQNRIHRIIGEHDNVEEAVRYSNEVRSLVPGLNSLPQFDMVILGVGEDGHTSSIFPGQEHLLTATEPYEPSVNPNDNQKRVAMTAPVILNSIELVFYLSGESKRQIVEKISRKTGDSSFPALFFVENRLNCKIFWDK